MRAPTHPIARLVAELDGVTDPDAAMDSQRIESYISEGLRDFAWDLAVARWAALRANSPASRRVAERDIEEASLRLDAHGLHTEADRVRAWVPSPEREGEGV